MGHSFIVSRRGTLTSVSNYGEISLLLALLCWALQGEKNTAMVHVEEKESNGSGHGSSAPGGVSPPSPPAASAILAQCLKLLRGQSDEHKFAGLVMVTKHVPALTASKGGSNETESSSSSPSGGDGGQLRQICNAVGPAFVHRLLRTPGDKSSRGGGDTSGGGLSLYQQIALGVLAAFFRDESLVSLFVS